MSTPFDVHEVAEPEDWREQALCAETDPEVFHPAKGGSAKAAKSICAACPLWVKAECFADVMAHDGMYEGIRAGLSYRERYRLRKGIAA